LQPYLEADSVYAGLFITRNEKLYNDVSSAKNELEVLVMENFRHQIPVSKFPTVKTIGQIEMAHIKSKEGISLGELILQLRTSFLGAITSVDLKRNSRNYAKPNKVSSSKHQSSDHEIDSLNLTTQQNDVLEGFRYELMQSLHRLTHVVSEEQLYSDARLVPRVFDIPIPDIISQKDTDTTKNQKNQKFAKLIIFHLSLPANIKPKLSRGEVCFLPFGMFEVYQNILHYKSKNYSCKFMQEPNERQNTKGKKIINNVNDSKVLNNCEEIEMDVIENNDNIEIVVGNKPIQNLKNLLQLRLSKDVRSNDRSIDEKRCPLLNLSIRIKLGTDPLSYWFHFGKTSAPTTNLKQSATA
ncbi:16307_t:CDS:2, partial [Dentiscutata erythropus]